MKEFFTTELIKKAKAAKSSAELIALAKENGVEITPEEAASCFTKLNPQSGDISDEELENVSGGGCHNSDGRLIVTGCNMCDHWSCLQCGGSTSSHTYKISPHLNTGMITCATNGTFSAGYGCSYCGHCSAAGGFVVCNHPANHA